MSSSPVDGIAFALSDVIAAEIVRRLTHCVTTVDNATCELDGTRLGGDLYVVRICTD